MNAFSKMATLTSIISLVQTLPATATEKPWDYVCTRQGVSKTGVPYDDKYFVALSPNFSAVYLKSFYNYDAIYKNNDFWHGYFPSSVLISCQNNYCENGSYDFYQTFEPGYNGLPIFTLNHTSHYDKYSHHNTYIVKHDVFTCQKFY